LIFSWFRRSSLPSVSYIICIISSGHFLRSPADVFLSHVTPPPPDADIYIIAEPPLR